MSLHVTVAFLHFFHVGNGRYTSKLWSRCWNFDAFPLIGPIAPSISCKQYYDKVGTNDLKTVLIETYCRIISKQHIQAAFVVVLKMPKRLVSRSTLRAKIIR